MAKKILLAAGGSGGHIFPALRVASVLKGRGYDVMIVGALQKFEDQVKSSGVEYKIIDVQGICFSRWFSLPKSCFKLFRAWQEAHHIIKERGIEGVLGFGGYSSFPFVVAGSQQKIPVVIHEQNVCPGRANRWLSLWADKVAVSFPQSTQYFPTSKVVHTGCPCDTRKDSRLREDILVSLGLDPQRFTLLIVGGSQGSERINESVATLLQDWRHDSIQVIHMAGPKQADELRKGYEQANILAYVVPFIEDMPAVYAACDIVIARSGAGVVWEVAYFLKKAIFIPYPHAGHHQLANAEALARFGWVKIIEQKNLDKKTLEEMIFVLKDDTIIPADGESRLKKVFLPHADECLAEALESAILS